jgi:hypothetical protein
MCVRSFVCNLDFFNSTNKNSVDVNRFPEDTKIWYCKPLDGATFFVYYVLSNLLVRTGNEERDASPQRRHARGRALKLNMLLMSQRFGSD